MSKNAFADVAEVLTVVSNDQGVPGVAAAAVVDGEVAHAAAHGWRDQERRLPMTVDTPSRWYSISKPLTALAIGRLVAAGKVRWDQPVSQLVPDLRFADPVATERATIGDCLLHRTGLPSGNWTWWQAPSDPAELLRRLPHIPCSGGSRAAHRYQNLGFTILGQVFKAAGGDWHQAIHDLLEPLGMKPMTRLKEFVESDRMLGYGPNGFAPSVQTADFDFEGIGPASAVCGTIIELAKVGCALARDGQGLLPPAIWAEAIRPELALPEPDWPELRRPCVALAGRSVVYQGELVLQWAGGWRGYVSHLLAVPSRRLAACAFANRTSANAAEALAFSLLDRAAGWERLPWAKRFVDQKREFRRQGEARLAARLARPGAPWPATDVAGWYFHPGYGELTVTDDLRLQFRHIDVPLAPRPDGRIGADGCDADFSEIMWDLRPIMEGKRILAWMFGPDDPAAPCRFDRIGSVASPAGVCHRESVSTTGVHYLNDVAVGAKVGQTIGAKVVTFTESQKDAEAVRDEITSALAKKRFSCQTRREQTMRMRMQSIVLGLAALAVQAGVCWAQESAGKTPWPTDVPGFVKPQPGEHPRLLFRKGDLPALKQKAKTPEGKAILKRLRTTLGRNGEEFSEILSGATKGYARGYQTYQGEELNKPGVFTIGHAAGYGLLYQLTGDRKYADLGRQAFEKMLEGVRDADSRYSFVGPNGELRAGSSWAWAALGYDLCYDGWDPEFRQKVAKAFLAVEIEQKGANLKKVVTRPKYGPAKNHFGGIMCGAAAAAAIAGDPGTEGEDIWGDWMPKAYEQTRRMLTGGFGDHGFYSEGHGPSNVSANTGLLMWLQAAKVACGKDFISPAPNGQWVTLRLVMEVVPFGGRPQWPDRKSSAGGGYGNEDIWRTRAQFAQGFGAIDNKYKPALLWTYRNFVEVPELKGVFPEKRGRDFVAEGWIEKGEKSYDVLIRPLHAVLAFVNWPVGMAPENPEKVMPKAMEDRVHGYYVFRNRWKDKDDILVSALLGYGPKDAYKPQYGPIYLWGLGKKYSFGSFRSTSPAEFSPGPNGGVVSTGTQCLAVDFSGASGAAALIALAGIDGPKAGGNLAVSSVDLGGAKVTIVTMQDGRAPAVKAEGGKISVGGQTITCDGKKLVFAR